MVLCNLCLSIPFEDLPQCPRNAFDDFGPANVRVVYIHIKPLFPHQPNLQALHISATECPLCRLILAQITPGLHEFDDYFVRKKGLGYPKFEIHLARRNGLGKGFLILSPSTENLWVFSFGAIGLAAREGDPLASIYPGRLIEGDLETSAILDRAAILIQGCDEHQHCITGSSWLPTRVIDVGDDKSSQTVRLFEPLTKTSERYIALSHCWGYSELPTTTRENKQQRLFSISLEEMTKSFKDAITITRFLGIRYIWIDSLCIIQNDLGDWGRESAAMHQVYSNAFLTISITGAEDGVVGCFPERTPQHYVRIPQVLKTGVNGNVFAFGLSAGKGGDESACINLTNEPLSNRGWCFQERALSRRIVHFAKNQVYFECMEGFRSEDGVHLLNRFPTLHSAPSQAGQDLNHYLNLWYKYLENYSARELSHNSDRLPAISGIAAIFAEKLDDQYLAGIWRKSIIEGLLWAGQAKTETEDRPPSWSWQAIDGGVTHLSLMRFKPQASILDYNIQLQSKSQFGAVKGGWIKMEAPLVPLILSSESSMASISLQFRMPNGIFGESLTVSLDSDGKKRAETIALANKSLSAGDGDEVLDTDPAEDDFGSCLRKSRSKEAFKEGVLPPEVWKPLVDQGAIRTDTILNTQARTAKLIGRAMEMPSVTLYLQRELIDEKKKKIRETAVGEAIAYFR